MMRTFGARNTIIWSAAACVLLACGPFGADDWVARVGDAEIGVGQLERAVDMRLDESPDLRREDVVNEELNRLIQEQVMLHRAAELEVSVSAEEVKARLASIHGADFSDDDPAYLAEVERQMRLDRTALIDLGDRVPVPESAMQLHFEENRERYSLPRRVSLRQIVVVERERAEMLRGRIEDGEDFTVLAANNSLAPEAPAGGLLPTFAEGELPEIFDLAFQVPPGRVSDVIESPYGFHLFRVEELLPARDPDFAEVRAEIQLELEQERLEELKREWLRGLRRRADVELNERLLEQLR